MVKLHLTMEDNTKSITQGLLEISGSDKRISCADARDFASSNSIGFAELGALCDDLGIKIYACELGCF
ncbi:MAG: hypothetical protein ACYC5A_01955 [Thermoleophilia bacterium]